jgi:hypothetical protein
MDKHGIGAGRVVAFRAPSASSREWPETSALSARLLRVVIGLTVLAGLDPATKLIDIRSGCSLTNELLFGNSLSSMQMPAISR